jgi:hypothetical protein
VIFYAVIEFSPTMSSTRSYATRSSLAARDSAVSAYSIQLESYAKKYMVSFDGSESLKDWSSRHADRFIKTVNNCVPLAVVTRDLADYVSKNTSKQTRLTVTRYHLEPSAQWSEGRSQFNKMLFSEFETWYSAFETEADEDEGGPSAASRWVYHCAKKLSRTGISVESLVPVVEAWLNEHLEC